jgi:putative DNA primase/helicase
MYAGGGSIGITGAARAVMRVAIHPEDPDMRVLAMVKTNLGPMPPSQMFKVTYDGDVKGRVHWHGETALTADDLDTYQRVSRRQGTDKRGAAVAFLQSELADGPVLASDLKERAGAAGLTWATVRRAQTAAGIVTKKEGFNGPWMWSIPPAP